MATLPNQNIWNDHSKNNFGESLRSQDMQKKLNEFIYELRLSQMI
jgi:hypothetical protein